MKRTVRIISTALALTIYSVSLATTYHISSNCSNDTLVTLIGTSDTHPTGCFVDTNNNNRAPKVNVIGITNGSVNALAGCDITVLLNSAIVAQSQSTANGQQSYNFSMVNNKCAYTPNIQQG